VKDFSRLLSRSGWSFGYGLVSQACSSAANLLLAIVAGQVLGPSGLGTIFVGFAAYLVLLGFERALVGEPLIAATSARSSSERRVSARHALTLVVVASVPAAAIFAAVGSALPHQFGRGMLVLAPWLVPALVQDLGRAIVFRDHRGPSAAASDVVWLATMAATCPLAFASDSDWVVAAVWGAGAVAGALVVLLQLRWRPSPFAAALGWWKANAWGFGRWLGLQNVLYSIASYATGAMLVAVLGSADYGGLRAVQSIFAPLTLLGPALALPGLPLVARSIGDPRRALKIAAQLGCALVVATAAYVVVMYAIPNLLAAVFGDDFADFHSIIVPIGIGQLVAAPTVGLSLFLTARQRGPALLALGTLNALSYLVFAVGLGLAFGLEGTAWAFAAASAVGGAALAALLRRELRGT
jgi:O-antigen/teichoic acid export membrane protein